MVTVAPAKEGSELAGSSPTPSRSILSPQVPKFTVVVGGSFGAGNYGRAISGIHHAYGIVQKRYNSATVGHSHKRGMYFKDEANAIGAVVGCYKGGDEGWAGQSNGEWWTGILVKRNIENGMYDPEFISMSRLEKEYGL